MAKPNPEMGCGGPCTRNPIRCKVPCDFAANFIEQLNRSPVALKIMVSSRRGNPPFRIERIGSIEEKTPINCLPANGTIEIPHEIGYTARVLEPVA